MAEKETPAYITLSKQESPPPSYPSDPRDLTAAFSDLKLDRSSAIPTAKQCEAHLKLLEVFSQLREDIGTNNGLYGLSDDLAAGAASSGPQELLIKICEKRWAVYVTRAASRFERWWNVTIEPGSRMLQQDDLASTGFSAGITTGLKPLAITKDNLPPLDVLMVWHAYMLNPRNFFEDCIRYGKMHFWVTGMPWEVVDACIDNKSFDYAPSAAARQRFEQSTGLAWDSLHDPPYHTMQCPKCQKSVAMPLTSCVSENQWGHRNSGKTGNGFADKHFNEVCRSCNVLLTHDLLRVTKFRRDLQLLLMNDVPMPGTLLSIDGLPEDASETNGLKRLEVLFPNRLIKAGLFTRLLELTEPAGDGTISKIRDLFEIALKDGMLVRKTSKGATTSRLEKVAIRRMLARYWENSSPLSLDLVGAVVRQGSFIEKMHSIDWIRSPAVTSTMNRLITKYQRYIEIIAKYPTQVAVPTLDVDLAWHTHQLSPKSYFTYTVNKTQRFIDHDDKIDENKLSNAFEWTSKTYQKMYNELYSECTCWYCEAVRESHTSTVSRIFKSTKGSLIASTLDSLSSSKDNSDPHKTPHISAHNAVRPLSRTNAFTASVQQAHLERNYEKACQRARKKGRPVPVRDEYVYTYPWGMPLYMPYYAPYMGDPCVTGGMYVPYHVVGDSALWEVHI
ncbi:Protein of unknown function DUF1399 [Lasallia pustulata]|uniref:Alpha-ketoglutarate-dependent sulfonate dioxygenase n=1 Tax=Lasallia pustulata TaxID=136370 RepID=A0A1W5D957_9LECA|nr:Protein of unknown function DUF1399 [Lasallia pustulata]